MSQGTKYQFLIYVAGQSPNSQQALARLRAICKEHLADDHSVAVVDVLRDPGRALQDNVLVTPTLLILSPGPQVRIIGNLSQTQTVLLALGIESEARDGGR